MGKTEKIVVLSVLFCVVVLFVWSIQSGGVDARTRAEDDSSTTVRRADPDQTRPLERDVQPVDDGRVEEPETLDGLDVDDAEVASGGDDRVKAEPSMLISGVGGEEPAPAPEPEAIEARVVRMQPGWDIVTTAGLEPTVDPAMLLYRPQEGATWESIARELYGDESKARLLRHNNESMDRPGSLIMVPAKDDLGAEGGVRIVEVLEGESLWGVAKRTLGSGNRWKEIYEANKDVLPDPDFVAPGTRLEIPIE